MTGRDLRAELARLVDARLRDDSGEAYRLFVTACNELRHDAHDAVSAARESFANGSPKERAAIADLVSRIDLDAPRDVHDAIYDALAAFLVAEERGEAHEEVIVAIVDALGNLYDERSVPTLLQLATHGSAKVRHAVASSLPSATNYEVNKRTAVVVDALVTLTGDADEDVRDWATFGLGQLGADTRAVRDALVCRMGDSDEDTRAEAFMALAQLRDERVVAPLLTELRGAEVGRLDVQAAGEFGDERFLAQLLEIAEWWQDDNGDRSILDEAIRRCTPGQ